MSSIINTNIAATRTHNVYNRNNVSMNQAMTRVATGMRINSAKDGASTWAISEKMLERIRANDQANQNVQNDQALLKTAQGGIGNTIDILKTLKERAVNAANDSNTNEDRARIATEVDQLIQQIDENVEKVKFNGKLLLDGSLKNSSEATFAASGTSSNAPVANSTDATDKAMYAVYSISGLNFKQIKSDGSAVENGSATGKLTDMMSNSASTVNTADWLGIKVGDKITLSWKADGVEKSSSIDVATNTTYTSMWTDLKGAGDGGELSVLALSTSAVSFTPKVNKTTPIGTEITAAAGEIKSTANSVNLVGAKGVVISDVSLSITNKDGTAERTAAQNVIKFTATAQAFKDDENSSSGSSTEGLTFYVGGEENFGLQVGINAMKASDLGVSNLANSMLDKSNAESAIKTIDNALAKALNEQTKLGSWESRLGYTSDNLVTMNENLEAANSVMRDSDVAKEMTTYMRYAVLSQASQYMLAQAGQNAYQVLNLLNV